MASNNAKNDNEGEHMAEVDHLDHGSNNGSANVSQKDYMGDTSMNDWSATPSQAQSQIQHDCGRSDAWAGHSGDMSARNKLIRFLDEVAQRASDVEARKIMEGKFGGVTIGWEGSNSPRSSTSTPSNVGLISHGGLQTRPNGRDQTVLPLVRPSSAYSQEARISDKTYEECDLRKMNQDLSQKVQVMEEKLASQPVPLSVAHFDKVMANLARNMKSADNRDETATLLRRLDEPTIERDAARAKQSSTVLSNAEHARLKQQSSESEARVRELESEIIVLKSRARELERSMEEMVSSQSRKTEKLFHKKLVDYRAQMQAELSQEKEALQAKLVLRLDKQENKICGTASSMRFIDFSQFSDDQVRGALLSNGTLRQIVSTNIRSKVSIETHSLKIEHEAKVKELETALERAHADLSAARQSNKDSAQKIKSLTTDRDGWAKQVEGIIHEIDQSRSIAAIKEKLHRFQHNAFGQSADTPQTTITQSKRKWKEEEADSSGIHTKVLQEATSTVQDNATMISERDQTQSLLNCTEHCEQQLTEVKNEPLSPLPQQTESHKRPCRDSSGSGVLKNGDRVPYSTVWNQLTQALGWFSVDFQWKQTLSEHEPSPRTKDLLCALASSLAHPQGVRVEDLKSKPYFREWNCFGAAISPGSNTVESQGDGQCHCEDVTSRKPNQCIDFHIVKLSGGCGMRLEFRLCELEASTKTRKKI